MTRRIGPKAPFLAKLLAAAAVVLSAMVLFVISVNEQDAQAGDAKPTSPAQHDIFEQAALSATQASHVKGSQ